MFGDNYYFRSGILIVADHSLSLLLSTIAFIFHYFR